jgi:hypothetical protein
VSLALLMSLRLAMTVPSMALLVCRMYAIDGKRGVDSVKVAFYRFYSVGRHNH